jgi:rhamnosyltransferase
MQLKRAAIFVFYDESGIADGYIDYYLSALSKHVSRLVVVCNCPVQSETEALFRKYTNEIHIRENEGYDALAYKYGLEMIGWDQLSVYDEVILANDTVFGPIFPFDELFSAMSDESLDFWGVTKHEMLHDDATSRNPFGHMPEHIQSYFIVLRKRLLSADLFREYWLNLGDIHSREAAIGRHETYFTKFFADHGYIWDVYAMPTDEDDTAQDAMFHHPLCLLKECRLPFVKRKLFNTDTLTDSAGEQPRAVFDYLKDETDYNTDLIWAYLTRTCHQYDFVKSLALTYILSDQTRIVSTEQIPSKPRVALLMHLFYEDMFRDALHYARSLPSEADIYISVNDSGKANVIRTLFETIENKVEVRLVENRGRSESALLVGMADAAEKYDLLCFWKEKRSGHISPASASRSWAYKISENLLCTETYVQNILSAFEDNPRLGLLSPPPPNHAKLYAIPGREWDGNYENVLALSKQLKLSVPMTETKPPVCPLGGSFWFRATAMKKLFAYGWDYDDFPTEPIPGGGTVLHAIERIYPFVVQDAGYYPAYVLSDRYASLDYTNLLHYLRTMNAFAEERGIGHLNYRATIGEMEGKMIKRGLFFR